MSPSVPAWQRFALALAGALLCLGALPWLLPLPARLSEAPSTTVHYRDGSLAWAGLAPDDRWRLETRLEQLDPAYIEALIRYEDRRFRWHSGVDPLAVVRAAGQDLWSGRVVSGASTITMQLVRVLEPRPRTIGSKLIEAARALQLELRLSKDEILEAYTTFVPYGRNLEGVQTASWALFGHAPDALTAEEIVTLLAIPQDPCDRYPRPGSEERLRSARLRITERLLSSGLLAEDAAEARALMARVAFGPQPARLRPLPRNLPHAAMWMRGQAPEQVVLASTIERDRQRAVEAILTNHRATLRTQGIHDVAVVVVDHRDGSIRALAGGFDFRGSRSGAQIPAFAQPRSPGSTLKPFILARAMDRGLALPETVVLDLPRHYDGWTPRNYDGGYRGTVRLDTALPLSLNLPFVALLERVGLQDAVGLLRSGGARSLSHDPAHYGLSLAVGGVELTPLELAELYATLAHDGGHRPLRWRRDRPRSPVEPLISVGASWLTRRALSQLDRPDFAARAELDAGPSPFHFKTGTSAANRDAWAAGSGPSLTAVVWLGNLDGSGSEHLVGGRVAAPLLFDLLEALEGPQPAPTRPVPTEALVVVRVCPLSGLPVGPHCPHADVAQAPAGSAPAISCPLHVEIELDTATGERVGPGCRQGRETRRETRVIQPPALRHWRAAQGGPDPSLPPLAAGCSSADEVAPRIVRPRVGEVVMLLPDLAPEQQELPLMAEVDQPGGTLWWYVDGHLLDRVDADSRAWWTPRPGRHELVVLSSGGMGARRWVEVRGGS